MSDNQPDVKDSPAVKDLVEKYGQNTTLHGVRGVCDSSQHLFQRILWLVLLCSGLAGYSAISFISISRYFNYESVSKISTTQVKSLDFPAVTICDQNIIPLSVLNTYSEDFIECITKGLYTGLSTNDTKCMDILQHGSFFDIMQSRQEQFFNDIFIRCVFNKVLINCSDYFQLLMVEDGVCYTFMPSQLISKIGQLTQSVAGLNYGLDVLIDTRVDEYIYSYKDGEGIRVLVHNPEYYPSIDEESFAVKPGVEAYVAIKKLVKKTLGMPYASIPCQETGAWYYDYKPMRDAGFLEYSYGACRFDCLYKHMVAKCGCQLDTLDNDGCSMLESFSCGQEALQTFYQNASSDCSCLQLCTEVLYDYKISTLSYPTPYTLQKLKHSDMAARTYDDLRKNMISLYIYFQNMEYDTIEQVPSKTGSEIIADIGGQMGLFVGASLITVFEIFECIILIVKKKCSSKNKVGGTDNFKEKVTENEKDKNMGKSF